LPFINPFLDNPADHFYFFGDLLFEKGSERGKYTLLELGLNHEGLVRARKRRINHVHSLIVSWRASSPILKESALGLIHEELASGEYESMVKALLVNAGVPLPIT
jgi:hypothetical protein